MTIKKKRGGYSVKYGGKTRQVKTKTAAVKTRKSMKAKPK